MQNLKRLEEAEIEKILNENQQYLNLSEKQKIRWFKSFLCLVKFKNLEMLKEPLKFEHQSNMDDWLILNKIEDVLQGTSTAYNYENSKFKKN